MANNQIALLAQTPEFDSPIESQGKALQMRQLMNAGMVQDMDMQQRRQAIADDAATRDIYARTEDPAERIKALYKVNPKAAQVAQKAQFDIDKIGADVSETKAKTVNEGLKAVNTRLTQARDLLGNINDQQGAAQWTQGLYADKDIGPFLTQHIGPVDQVVKNIPDPRTNPADFAKWKHASQLSAEKLVQQTSPDANARLSAQTTEASSKRSAAASKYSADSSASSARARLAFEKSQAEGTGPDASESMVDAIGTGRLAPPSGYALRNPKILAMMERVGQKYPEYDATEYAGKTKAMRDFSSGTQGNSIRSFAVASEHLKQLDGLVDALENKDVPLINKYGNKLAQATGSTAPTNFDAAKGIVAKEVLKSIVAGGGGVEERQELAHLLDNAKTTKQLKGVIGTYLHLMGAQKEGLERQYELATGRKDAKTRFNYDTEGKAGGGVIDFGSLK